MTAELFTPMNTTFFILFLTMVFFIHGKIRTDIIALCSLIALVLCDIITANEALLGFSSPVVIMMLGLFVVGAGIFRTGLAKIISSRILRLAQGRQSLLFILIILVTGFTGAFVSNTGTVAVMMPIVISLAQSSGVSPKRYLMPLAFASSLGYFTLISTPPNLVVQEYLQNNNFTPLGFFDFAPIGVIVLFIGLIYLFFTSNLLVKNKSKDEKKLNDGKSLEDLAKEYGTDGTKTTGGSLGYVEYDNTGMDKDFLKAAKALNEGQVSDPVKTQFGYHIIMVKNVHKDKYVKSFDEVKKNIEDTILLSKKSEIYKKKIEEWKKEYKVTENKENLNLIY